MRYLFIILIFFFGSAPCSSQHHKSAQDSFVRYIDKFLRMDPDFSLEFQENLNWEDFAESISFYMELGGEEWNTGDEFPELFTHYGDVISEHLAREIVEQKFGKIYTQYFVKVECWNHGDDNPFWIIHVDVYFN